MFDLLIAWLLSLLAPFGGELPTPHETPTAIEAVDNEAALGGSLPTTSGPGRSAKNDAAGDIYNGF